MDPKFLIPKPEPWTRHPDSLNPESREP
jgi:hypothetical protein